MADEMEQAQALAQEVEWGRHDPALTDRIAACPCPEPVKAGLHLMNGDLDASHRIAQSLSTPLGAHWHALMHRHEPDLSNSMYWQRRAGTSPIYPRLVEAARELGHGDEVAPEGIWDPIRFTQLYAEADRHPWTRDLDALEIRTLLEHCLAAA